MIQETVDDGFPGIDVAWLLCLCHRVNMQCVVSRWHASIDLKAWKFQPGANEMSKLVKVGHEVTPAHNLAAVRGDFFN
jgi:hypothetical protein